MGYLMRGAPLLRYPVFYECGACRENTQCRTEDTVGKELAMTDLHCHLLPAVDDGSPDLQTSLELLRQEAADGVAQIIATPHFESEEESAQEFLARRDEALAALRAAAEQSGGKLPRVLPGAEIMVHESLAGLDALERLTLGDTSLLLIEMPHEDSRAYLWMPSLLKGVQQRGFTPVFAHVERYEEAFEDEDFLRSLIENGACLQVNFDTLITAGFRQRRRLKRYFQQGLIQFVGTDAHNLTERPPRFAEGCRALSRLCGDARATELLRMQNHTFEPEYRLL